MPTAPLADPPPTAELHVHLEGTLEPELIFALAARHSVALPYRDIQDLRSRYEFTDLQSFLDLYYANLAVLRTAADFAELTQAYLRRARTANVRHAEIFLDPQAHTSRGVEVADCVGGVAEVLRTSQADFGISTGLIPTFLRDRPEAEAIAVLTEILDLDLPIIGIGLDSAEIGHPPADFARLYDFARARGLHLVAHAGEEGPAAYVREALDILRVERIDHGIRCMDDEQLVARLVADGIALTVCPLSNVRLRAVATMADHPLPGMLAAGLRVCINSDDPAYFGGYVDDNYRAVVDAFGFDRATVARLARNSVQASFVDPARATDLLRDIRAWEAATSVPEPPEPALL